MFDKHAVLVKGDKAAARLCCWLVAASAWFEMTPMPDGSYEFTVKNEELVLALVQQSTDEIKIEEAVPPIPPAMINKLLETSDAPSITKEVADRLHRWGDKDALYTDVEDTFLDAYDQDGFVFGEQFFYDPETGKAYRTQLKLEIDESEPPDEDTCPECGGDLADATDIPDDVICDVCGWSRSGVRRCIRCGTKDLGKLVNDDAVCRECRAAGPKEEKR